MMRIGFILLVTLLTFILSSCSEELEQKEGEYDKTKKMVVDILQTEDGKKALKELITDEKMKKELVIESDVVKDSINHVLVSEKGANMWKNLFSDPTFVEHFAESMSEEQKKLMKSLMNDAGFQKQMIDLLQNPEINQQMLSVMKGQQFRSHLEELIEQTLETPLYQAKITELLLNAAEEQKKAQEQEGDQQGEEQSDTKDK